MEEEGVNRGGGWRRKWVARVEEGGERGQVGG